MESVERVRGLTVARHLDGQILCARTRVEQVELIVMARWDIDVIEAGCVPMFGQETFVMRWWEQIGDFIEPIETEIGWEYVLDCGPGRLDSGGACAERDQLVLGEDRGIHLRGWQIGLPKDSVFERPTDVCHRRALALEPIPRDPGLFDRIT